MVIKNKVNPETGHFICGGLSDKGCGADVSLAVILRGVVYCCKCAAKLKRKKLGLMVDLPSEALYATLGASKD